jgi:hypothetical protein
MEPQSEHLNPVIVALYATGYRGLSEAVLTQINRHLDECEVCRSRVADEFRKVVATWSAERAAQARTIDRGSASSVRKAAFWDGRSGDTDRRGRDS